MLDNDFFYFDYTFSITINNWNDNLDFEIHNFSLKDRTGKRVTQSDSFSLW